jgi:hypothetical protein
VVEEELGTSVNLLAATTGPEGGQRGPTPASGAGVKKRVVTSDCGSSKRRPTWLMKHL